ncbi:MAG: Hsp20/alpha crystallin family protein [Haloferacaceae archaeon]
MNRLREFGESAANAVLDRIGRGMSRVQERTPLPADLLESDDAYLAVFDAPGVTRSDVQVRFVEGEIQVRIDRFRDFHEGFEMRYPGRGLSLDGSVALPEGAVVDPDGAAATLSENGVLEVRLPKTAPGRDVPVDEAESVEVHAGGGDEADDEGEGTDDTGDEEAVDEGADGTEEADASDDERDS